MSDPATPNSNPTLDDCSLAGFRHAEANPLELKLPKVRAANRESARENVDRFIVISGCSGGGKSTLLAELKRRGYGVVEEPGRRVIEEERAANGNALPWVDLARFAQKAVTMSLSDLRAAEATPGLVFFDRGLIDASAALAFATGDVVLELSCLGRYNSKLFLTPTWPEIYINDVDRRHNFSEAVEEYERLSEAFKRFHYETLILPKTNVVERADFILSNIA